MNPDVEEELEIELEDGLSEDELPETSEQGPDAAEPAAQPAAQPAAEPAAQPTKGFDQDEFEGLSEPARERIRKILREEAEARQRAEQERLRAEQALQQSRAEQEQMRTRAAQLDAAVVAQHKARIDAEVKQARAELAKATESGDNNAYFDATQKVARLAIEQERVRLAEARLQQRPELAAQPAAQPTVQPTVQPVQPDERTRAWAARNKWFGEDPVLTGAAYGIHAQLLQEGVAPSSDRYFEQLDKRLEPLMRMVQQPTTPPARPALAPGKASASLTGTGQKKKVTLTRAQVETAKALGVSLTDYARELARLDKRE